MTLRLVSCVPAYSNPVRYPSACGVLCLVCPASPLPVPSNLFPFTRALPGCCEAVTNAIDPMTFLTSLKGVGTATAERIVSVLGPDMDSITEALSQPQPQAVKNLMKVRCWVMSVQLCTAEEH